MCASGNVVSCWRPSFSRDYNLTSVTPLLFFFFISCDLQHQEPQTVSKPSRFRSPHVYQLCSDRTYEHLRYHLVHGHSLDCIDSVQFDSFPNQEIPSEKIANLRAHEHATKVSEDERDTSGVNKSCGLLAHLWDAVACFKKNRWTFQFSSHRS